MSVSHQTRRRLPTIKAELLKGSSYERIGDQLGVTRRTIDRDMDTFLQSGEFETWLKEEWVRLHTQIIHDNPTEAYRNLTKLVSRLLTRRVESHHIEEVREIQIQWLHDDAATHDPVPAAPRPTPVPPESR